MLHELPPTDLLRPMMGLTVFAAEKGYASCVTFSLTSTPDVPKEEFFFWIHMCNWRMRSDGQELAHSESEDDTIKAAAAKLNGRRLEVLKLEKWITPEGIFHGATLWFGPTLTLRLQQYAGEAHQADECLLRIRNAQGTWVAYQSDGSVASESADPDEADTSLR